MKSSYAARCRLLGYAPTQRIGQGLALVMPWYIAHKNSLNQPVATV
ncbi:MAG: hypothetical protein JJD98_12980 [Polaromonas sp.]|nr:hypothetical protein [Polaromonas sp.]